jgi:hypothetical protein
LIQAVTAALDRSVAARLMGELKGKLALWRFMEQVRCCAERGNRWNHRAKQFVFDGDTNAGGIFTERSFATRGALN